MLPSTHLVSYSNNTSISDGLDSLVATTTTAINTSATRIGDTTTRIMLSAEAPPPALSPRSPRKISSSAASLSPRSPRTPRKTSSGTMNSVGTNIRISRKHRTKQRKPRVSVKFQAQNFVKNRCLGEDLEEFYDIGDKIGEGGFGEVFSVVHQKTGMERAVKVIYKTEDTDVDFEKVNTTIKNEFAVVKSLDHPNLLKQYEMFEDDDKFMIVTDVYRGGELLDELEAIGCFQEDDAALLLNHMLTCINYIHSNNLAHRDLKPENILLEQNMKLDDIKIIDFGLAKQAAPGTKFKDFVGTSYYMAPQIVKEEPYTNKCDVWACGVIAFLVLGGYAPFDGDRIDDICDAIKAGEVIFDDEPEVWDTVSDSGKEFVRYLLAYEEDDRPTAHAALQHPWLQDLREKSTQAYRRSRTSSICAANALKNMEDFESGSKLKQATYALIASQLLLKEEKEEIDAVFRILDADCSGRITRKEVKLGYKEFYGQDLSNEEVEVIFRRVNFSGSGAIEYSEFVVASLMHKEVLNDERLKAAFDEFDLDGNGSIDLQELKAILLMDDSMDDYVMNNIIKQVDKDGDGEISYEEFKSMMYITNSQPTKDKCEEWTKNRRESISLMDAMAMGDGSSHGTSMSSLRDIAGASSVLSIFDISSTASMRLEFDPEIEFGGSTLNIDRNDDPNNRSLSQLSDSQYATGDMQKQASFRRQRSLPQRFDPRRGFLKVDFSMSTNSKKRRSLVANRDLPSVSES